MESIVQCKICGGEGEAPKPRKTLAEMYEAYMSDDDIDLVKCKCCNGTGYIVLDTSQYPKRQVFWHKGKLCWK